MRTKKLPPDIKVIVDGIERARTQFDKELEQCASQLRALMLPYFKRREWTYVAGNGTWFITDKQGRGIDDDKLPSHMRNLLNCEVELHTYLGYYVMDITKEDVA